MLAKLVKNAQRICKCNVSDFFTSYTRCIGFSAKSNGSTICQDEVDKFDVHSEVFWDPCGAFRPLHNFNSHRVPFVREGLLNSMQVSKVEATDAHPLKGFKLVDVGCGAGVFSEPLARIGADVTGIDAAPSMVRVAQEHAALEPSLSENLRYVNTTVEEHAQLHANSYDALVCSEVIEHINDPEFFVEQCTKLVKPSGSLFFTTFNRNWLSWFCIIFVAENILGAIPKGTHDYKLLLTPEEISKMLMKNDCSVRSVDGLICMPNCEWKWIQSTLFSYAIHAVKHGP